MFPKKFWEAKIWVAKIWEAKIWEATQKYSGNSLMVMQFGQFLDHDVTLTAEADMCKSCGETVELCCTYFLGELNYRPEDMPNNCWPIPVPDKDPDFGGKNLIFIQLNFVLQNSFLCHGLDLVH